MKEKLEPYIKYIFLSIIFLGLTDSVFVGFFTRAFQYYLLCSGVAILTALCVFLERYPKAVWGVLAFAAAAAFFLRGALANGFQVISNRMADAVNKVYDMGFYYYVDIQAEYTRRDSILLILLLFLLGSVLFHLLARKTKVLVAAVSAVEACLLILTPYSITGPFLLFLCGIAGYGFWMRRKRYSAAVISGCLLLGAVAASGIVGEPVSSNPLKETALEFVRLVSQGRDYQVAGGIGSGDIGKIGSVSPRGTNLFKVRLSQSRTLYLKGFTSGIYENGMWKKEKKDAKVILGENSLDLPFQFFDLKIPELSLELLDTGLQGKAERAEITYQKFTDDYYLWPYFSNISPEKGRYYGDLNIARTSRREKETLMYYPVPLESMLKADGRITDALLDGQTGDVTLEREYFQAMDSYNQYAASQYTKVPKDLKKKLQKKFPELNSVVSTRKKAGIIQELLKKNYRYTSDSGVTPDGEDPIWYFLNENKKGYCTQYASAAVMMFRTAGIPCRYVEGYRIDKQKFQKNNTAQVTDFYAHAWPEIYIENAGWVPVEVTNTRSLLAEQEQAKEEPSGTLDRRVGFMEKNMVLQSLIVLFISLCVIVTIVKIIKEILRYRKWRMSSNKEKVIVYQNLINSLTEGKNLDEKHYLIFEKARNITEKARFSQHEITDEELRFVKRFVDILKKKI
ncbi:transglutaminase-like domain-containing protein [Anaerostipes sp.]|uniref:transglutaminase-like domain-containing protein n=1 Tax=Anaerostipes sp. TaxID=1872530 RepID=UPI0025BA9EAF|nr:transglutaminase-like domain-containing protein [Anaerostipes sp.]MBS7008722.1 transglutaminase domain-containing protein [Anaerostipes sp.]